MTIKEYMPFLLNLTEEQDAKIKDILIAFKDAVGECGLDRVLDKPALILPVIEFHRNMRMFEKFNRNKLDDLLGSL